MSKTLKFSALFIAMTITTSSALAQNTVNNITDTTSAYPEAAPTISHEQDGSNTINLRNVQSIDPDVAATSSSTMAPEDRMVNPAAESVAEVAKADGSIIDKLISHYNNREVEDIILMYSNDGFVMVEPNGQTINDATGLRKNLVSMFAGNKKNTYTAQVDSVKEVAPNLVLITAQYNSFEDGQSASPMAKLFVTTLAKYESNTWKIISQQLTDISKDATLVDADSTQTGSAIKMMLMGIIGVVVGFFGSKYMNRRQYPQA